MAWFDEEEDNDEKKEEEVTSYGKRVYNMGKSVEEWSDQTGNGSSWWDLCLDHVYDLERDSHCYDDILVPWNGDPDGEDGRGGDAAHLCYDDDEYRCFLPECRVLLTGW